MKSFRPSGSIGANGVRYGTPKEVFAQSRTAASATAAKKPNSPSAPEITIMKKRYRILVFIYGGIMKLQTAASATTISTGAEVIPALIALSPKIKEPTSPTAEPTAFGIRRPTSRTASKMRKITNTSQKRENGSFSLASDTEEIRSSGKMSLCRTKRATKSAGKYSATA